VLQDRVRFIRESNAIAAERIITERTSKRERSFEAIRAGGRHEPMPLQKSAGAAAKNSWAPLQKTAGAN